MHDNTKYNTKDMVPVKKIPKSWNVSFHQCPKASVVTCTGASLCIHKDLTACGVTASVFHISITHYYHCLIYMFSLYFTLDSLVHFIKSKITSETIKMCARIFSFYSQNCECSYQDVVVLIKIVIFLVLTADIDVFKRKTFLPSQIIILFIVTLP